MDKEKLRASEPLTPADAIRNTIIASRMPKPDTVIGTMPASNALPMISIILACGLAAFTFAFATRHVRARALEAQSGAATRR